MRGRILAVVAMAGAMLVTAAEPAAATCVGPTIRHDTGPVDRDGTVRVVGMHWGDACNDTGGGKVLGEPATGIEVLLVQGDAEHLVATGDADPGYRFAVDVPVPDELDPGPVEVVARSTDEAGEDVVARSNGLTSVDDATPEPLVVSERPPIGAGDDAPVRLGPWDGVALHEAGDGGGGPPALVYAAGAVLLVAGLVALGLARQRGAHGR